MTQRTQAALRTAIIILITSFRSVSAQETQTLAEQLYSPIYNPKQSIIWNAAKATGYLAGSMDAYSTTRALSRGCHELNMVDNIFMDSQTPHLSGRQLSSFMVQYGFNTLLDWGWRRANKRWEKAVYIGVRAGLTSASIWAWSHNNKLGYRR